MNGSADTIAFCRGAGVRTPTWQIVSDRRGTSHECHCHSIDDYQRGEDSLELYSRRQRSAYRREVLVFWRIRQQRQGGRGGESITTVRSATNTQWPSAGPFASGAESLSRRYEFMSKHRS